MYNAREHPKYKNGEMTEMEVFQEFLKSFEPNDEKDGKVSELLTTSWGTGHLYMFWAFLYSLALELNTT